MTLTDMHSDIGDAIREQTGGSALIPIAGMPTEIRSIQSGGGGGGLEPKDVNFYTPYGDLVAAYTVAELQGLSALPAAPALDRLVFQEWGWTLAELKAAHRPVDVGGNYTTESGKSEFDLLLNAVTGLSVTLRFQNTGSTLYVDYGDGNTENVIGVGNRILTHNYAAYGQYTVSVESSGTYRPFGADSPLTNMFGPGASAVCIAARFGTGCSGLGVRSFYDCHALRSITMPSGGFAPENHALRNCVQLGCLILPRGMGFTGNLCQGNTNMSLAIAAADVNAGAAYGFASCPALTSYSIGNTQTIIADNTFRYNSGMQSIIIPAEVSQIGVYAFDGGVNMRKYVLCRATPPTLLNVNAFSGISAQCEMVVPQGSLPAYQAATNWATYAAYMREMTTAEMTQYGLAV